MMTLTHRRQQAGFTLIELIISLVLMAIVSVVLVEYSVRDARERLYAQVARQTYAIGLAGSRYVEANHDALVATAGPTTPVVVTTAQLVAGQYLQGGSAALNDFGQAYELRVIKDAAGNLQPLVLTTGGQPIDGDGMRQIARMVTAYGGAGGFIDNTAPDTAGPWVAAGPSGWSAQLSNYGSNPGVGHLADALFFAGLSDKPDVSLHRTYDPANPQYNQMQTTIDAQGHDIANVGHENLYGTLGTNGLSPTAGLPSGWGGGVHTWDVYAEGTIAAGRGGNVSAWIDPTAGDISIGTGQGWFRSYGNTGWYNQSYGGGIFMSDANWLRVYNDKGFYTGGQVQAGTVVANGRLDTHEYLQVDGQANIGWSCSPNGLTAQASDGSGMAQCKQGVWVLMQGVNDSIQVTSPGSACGNTNTWATAVCPAGYKISGGGYYLTAWRPVSGESGNSPDNNAPSGNGWAVYPGNMVGNTCFAAYAVCVK